MEGYILGGRNIPESQFKEEFKKVNGERELKEFMQTFRFNFIVEEDFANIQNIKANTVRLPFHYKVFKEERIILKRALEWAQSFGLKVILDLHAAPGSQNQDWHSDSFGKALLWKEKRYQEETIELWEEIASTFKDSSSLLGYDLLNEPVVEGEPRLVKELYKKIIFALRKIDKKHLIFMEGDIWAQRIDFLKELLAENVQVSIHTYQPLNYVFNFTPFLKYPGRIEKTKWDKKRIYKYLEPYYLFSQKHKVKILVGEFGINWRGGLWGESVWLKDILDAFNDFGFGYIYWTYKAVANYNFPDGLYQYINNHPYIRREGPTFGWENYIYRWKKEKKNITEFWRSENFNPNQKIISLLKSNFNK